MYPPDRGDAAPRLTESSRNEEVLHRFEEAAASMNALSSRLADMQARTETLDAQAIGEKMAREAALMSPRARQGHGRSMQPEASEDPEGLARVEVLCGRISQVRVCCVGAGSVDFTHVAGLGRR